MSDDVIILRRRPEGRLVASDFTLSQQRPELPQGGQVTVAVHHLSIDPYLRGLLDEHPFVGLPVPVGGVMVGRGIGEVVTSQANALQVGDLVYGDLGWRRRATVAADGLRRVALGRHPLTWQLGALGIPGITAWRALELVAAPQMGETVLVSSAAGAVGSAAGQIARAAGCTVVGIAGGAQKTALLETAFGFDAAIDYKATTDLAQSIASAVPQGIDIYFDNVGGAMLEAALLNMKPNGRIILCGNISTYEASSATRGLQNANLILARQLRVEGFSIRNHLQHQATALKHLNDLADTGKLRQVETIYKGLQEAPTALIDLLQGKAVGKAIVSCDT